MKRVFSLSILLLSVYFALCFGGEDKIGTSGGKFLRIPAGARTLGMGGVGVSVADDPAALHYNPACLGQIRHPSALLMYDRWLAGMHHGWLGVVYPVRGVGSFGLGYINLHSGKIQGWDDEGIKEDTFTYLNHAIILSYARLSRKLSLGGSLKIFSETCPEEGEGFGGGVLDIGALYKRRRFSIGACIRNFGPDVSEGVNAPFDIALGGSLRPIRHLVLAGDFIIPKDGGPKVHLGGEYTLWDVFAIRLGARLGYDQQAGTAGLGFRWRGLCFDYALTQTADLGLAHQVSTTFSIGKPALPHRVVDKAPPDISITSPASLDIVTNLGVLTVSFEVMDEGGLKAVKVGEDLIPGVSGRSFTYTKRINLIEGENTIQITAMDMAGNRKVEKIHAFLDTIRPEVTLTSPAPGERTSLTEIAIAGEASDNHRIVGVSIDGKELTIEPGRAVRIDCVSPVLRLGENKLKVVVKDAAGNTASQTIEIIREEKRPVKIEKRNIAVVDLQGISVSEMEASVISEFLRTELINTGYFNVIERGQMDKILGEQALQATGCTTEECAVEIGKLLNVQLMVLGSFSRLMNMYYVNVRFIDVEKGFALFAESVKCKDEAELQEAVKALAAKIVKRFR